MNDRYVLKIAFTAVIRPQAKKTKKQKNKDTKEQKKLKKKIEYFRKID